MVPRPEVVAISVNLPSEEALQAVLESPYTRYPVYGESLDDIVGVLHIRDLIEAMHDRGLASVKITELVRPVSMVPETKDLAALLTEFRRTNQHLAVVIDEYGSMEGIVTLEDLLEEIVGEIEDEFDLPDETVERVSDDTVRIDGTFTIDDFNEEFGCDLSDDDYHTVGGFVFGQLGRAAEPGDEVSHDGVLFHVDSLEGQRIHRLTVTFQPLARAARHGREARPPSNRHRAGSRMRAVIEFHLDPRSGVAPYMQIVQQVKEALRLGLLDVGDQLPTVREVVAELAINPNTVAKAYRDLERDGLVVAQQGRGTFVRRALAPPSLQYHDGLRADLERWLESARRAGLDEESVRALISSTLREALGRRIA